MFGLRQRLEAWRGRASQPREPNQTRAQAKPPDAALSGLEPASAVDAGSVDAGVGVSETPGAPPASAHPTAMRQAEALKPSFIPLPYGSSDTKDVQAVP